MRLEKLDCCNNNRRITNRADCFTVINYLQTNLEVFKEKKHSHKKICEILGVECKVSVKPNTLQSLLKDANMDLPNYEKNGRGPGVNGIYAQLKNRVEQLEKETGLMRSALINLYNRVGETIPVEFSKWSQSPTG